MRVDELIKRLQKERPDEEVVVIIGGDTNHHHLIDEAPFLHAGPKVFTDIEGKEFSKSVVTIKLKKRS